MNDRRIPGFCTLCRSRCGTLNTIRDGHLVAVEADPDHPTGKATCAKGRAAPEIVHSHERILHPLKRTRPKGDPDPGWVRIGWDEALREISSRLLRYRRESGAESVAFAVTTPSGTPISDSIDWIERFIRRFGSPNIVYGTELCNWHKDVAHAFTFGCGIPVADYADAGLAILWGHNPANVWLAQAGRIGDGGRRGARLLVVDPRDTAHARQADLWLRIRPGTDAALALGLTRLLIGGRRFDEDFLRRWTNAPFLVEAESGLLLRAEAIGAGEGFVVHDPEQGRAVPVDTRLPPDPDLARRAALDGEYDVPLAAGGTRRCRPAFRYLTDACEDYGVERVSELTGLAPADIERAAELIAEAGDRVCYHGWTGIGQHANASQTERAIAVLYALTGAFDAEGGNRVYGPLPFRKVNPVTLLEEGQRAKALGLGERPLGPPASGWVLAQDVYRAVLEEKPYPVRALFGFGGNMLVSHPGTREAEEALRRVGFHVHCDLFHTPTNAFADILLPAGSPWEHEGLRLGFEIDAGAAGHVQLRPRMVPPRGEARPDYAIVLDLACRMGMGDDFFGGDIEAGWNHMLAPLGLDVASLRREPRGIKVPVDAGTRKYARTTPEGHAAGFGTQTRRVEIYSELLKRHGYPPVPDFQAPAAAAPGRPLTLVTAKNGYYCHSQHRNLSSLRRRSPDPVATVSPDLARRRGLEDGDPCVIATELGEARMRLKLSPALAPDVVVAEYGWWQACDDLGLPGRPVRGEGSANVNAVIDDRDKDPLSGAIALRSSRCDIRRPAEAGAPRWQGWQDFRVARTRQEAPGVTSLWLARADGLPLPAFLPGQHVTIELPPEVPGEEPVTRSYSLSDADRGEGQDAYRITVKRVVQRDAEGRETGCGLVSGRLNRAPGEEARLRARMPAGRFTIPLRHPCPLVLIAGGIGITPFMGHLETLALEAERGGAAEAPEVVLIYANPNGASHAFRERIAELKERLPRLSVIDVYSAPLPHEMPGRDFDVAGIVGEAVVDQSWIDRRARFYLCGPKPMMEHVKSLLAARGVLPFEIFSEEFRSPLRPAAEGGRRHRIRFRRTGAVVDWTPAEGSVLDAAERQGVRMASGCRVGQCESCAVRLLEGRAMQLAESQHLEDGVYLTCQMIPLTDVVLDA
jgi:anaerobic selenocysteine-containing dehydrogenase/ferredoxin-NADP reductase